MSSYLNLYLVPKKKDSDDKDQKPLLLVSFSRNNDMYQAIVDSVNVAYGGNEEKYTELTVDLIYECQEDLELNMKKLQRKIDTYEKNMGSSPTTESIEQLNDYKEIYDDMRTQSDNLGFLEVIISDCTLTYSDFEKVLCNIS